MIGIYILCALLFLYFLYKKFYKKGLKEDFDNEFHNDLIKINNINYELDDYSINNILNELNYDITI
jgi:hypothetical protein